MLPNIHPLGFSFSQGLILWFVVLISLLEEVSFCSLSPCIYKFLFLWYVCRQDHTQALNHCQGFLAGFNIQLQGKMLGPE